MNAEKFTQKTIETINDAQNLARDKQNQTIAPEHLLYALLSQEGGRLPSSGGSSASAARCSTESGRSPATPTLSARCWVN